VSKRQIVLDTETTGLSVEDDHRIIEIGCIELRDRRPGEDRFHCYLNPEREVDAGAVEVHGISQERLRDAPRFAEVVEAFLAFVRGAEVIIHNARFDVGFIDRELARLGPNWGQFSDYCTVLDTLEEARKLHPGQRNSLDALCKRYDVDNFGDDGWAKHARAQRSPQPEQGLFRRKNHPIQAPQECRAGRDFGR